MVLKSISFLPSIAYKNGFKKDVFISVNYMDSETALQMIEELLSFENENVVSLQDKVRFTSSSSKMENIMKIIHNSMVKNLRPFINETERVFLNRNIREKE